MAPRFARLDESWAKDFYWHILMKYPSFLMILEVISSIFLTIVLKDNVKLFSFCFNLTTMPWICPPAFAPVAPREDRADLVSTLSAKPSSVLQGKDFTFPGCVFVGHIFDHFLFRWRLRRLCLARILTSKKTFRSNNSTSNAKKKLPLYSEVIHSTFQVNKLTLEKVTRQRQRLEVSETIRSDILRYYFPEKLENKAHMIYKCLFWFFIHAAIGTQVSCFTTTWARNL